MKCMQIISSLYGIKFYNTQFYVLAQKTCNPTKEHSAYL